MENQNQSHLTFEDLSQNLLFPKVFLTFRYAIQPSKLMIALAALVVISIAGWVMDFSNTVVSDADGKTELHVYIDAPAKYAPFVESNSTKGERTGVFHTLWHFNRERFHKALESLFAFNLVGVADNVRDCFNAVCWAFRHHFWYCAIFFLIKLAVISVAGGAICRIAALQLAQGEKPGTPEPLRFAARRFLSFFPAPLVPLGIVAFIGAFVALLGLAGNIPYAGELVVGIFAPLALLAGALITVVLIGAVTGFNLMFPAVAYDGSDCFDAISRAFNYVYSRPWRMVLYTGIAAVYGAICYLFVRVFAFLLLFATHALLDVLMFSGDSGPDKLSRIWPPPAFAALVQPMTDAPANGSEWVAANLIRLFVLVVIGLVVAFIMSFYFSANTIIYALLRKKVDNTALEDIYRPAEETQREASVTQYEADQSQEEFEHPDSSSSTE
jgi:hypothetical protein